jgi:hypothetical protein
MGPPVMLIYHPQLAPNLDGRGATVLGDGCRERGVGYGVGARPCHLLRAPEAVGTARPVAVTPY